MEPWATWFFRVLWFVLLVSLVWAGFTLYAIGRACFELYQLGGATRFVPAAMLSLVALFFGVWALKMLGAIAYTRAKLFEASMEARTSSSR